MGPCEAEDMDRFYLGHQAAIRFAKAQGLRTVIPEADFQEEIFDKGIGSQGLVLPMSQELRSEALLQSINAFVGQSVDHASLEQLLGAYGRKHRERTGYTNFDDSDDSESGPSVTELMYR